MTTNWKDLNKTQWTCLYVLHQTRIDIGRDEAKAKRRRKIITEIAEYEGRGEAGVSSITLVAWETGWSLTAATTPNTRYSYSVLPFVLTPTLWLVLYMYYE